MTYDIAINMIVYPIAFAGFGGLVITMILSK